MTRYPRTNVSIPTGPLATDKGGWATRCRVFSVEPKHSLLDGRTIAVKDNIALAGVRCLNGIRVPAGQEWVPDFDATVVTRLLDAGAVIMGKAGELLPACCPKK